MFKENGDGSLSWTYSLPATIGIDWSFLHYNKLVFPKPTRVIFSGGMTHIFWEDDSKTTVKWDGIDAYDPEHAVAIAIAHKMFGSKNKFKKFVATGYIQPSKLDEYFVAERTPEQEEILHQFIENTQDINND